MSASPDNASLFRGSTGVSVRLGQLVGRGGEGTVHAVVGAPKLVAKIYAKPPDAAKSEKLKHMIRGHSPALLGVAAWPVDVLVDQRGAVRGFLMGRISARQDAHRLYSPKSRRGTFPGADFRFVVRAAANVARAFAQIHGAGHVIGDVNHGNALIGKDGTAILIDCDSIQVSDRGRTFTCDVGTPLFTAPELQGKAFRGLVREQNQDRFGLAVLVFHLLFQGRHPFAGVFSGGDLSIERSIAESRFAYGANAAQKGMSAPPGTLPLHIFGAKIAGLFERAFAPPGGADRPSAIEWIESLQELEQRLVACPVRPRHFHPRDGACCWCAIEVRTGARLFDDTSASSSEFDAMTAEQLWRDIERVSVPAPVIETPEFAEQQQTALRRLKTRERWSANLIDRILPFSFAFGLLGITTYIDRPVIWMTGLGLAAGVFAALHFALKGPRVARAARAEWARAVKHWRDITGADAFFRMRASLAASRASLTTLAERRVADIERLVRRLEVQQRAVFLDSFEIGKAMLLHVSRNHVERLSSRGIRSAGDVVRHRRKLRQILDADALGELDAWVDQCAASFQFNTSDPQYRAEAERVEERCRKQRQSILESLSRGPELLEAKRNEIADARAKAEVELRQAHERLQRRRQSEDG